MFTLYPAPNIVPCPASQVKLTRSIPYSSSNSRHERFHLIEPLAAGTVPPGRDAATAPPLPVTNSSSATAVVSVHGGGFVTTCKYMLHCRLEVVRMVTLCLASPTHRTVAGSTVATCGRRDDVPRRHTHTFIGRPSLNYLPWTTFVG